MSTPFPSTRSTKRRSKRPPRGVAKDYRAYQSDENVLADNARILGLITGAAITLLAGAAGLFGWQAVRKTALDAATKPARTLGDQAIIEFYQDTLLTRNKRVQKNPALAAKLINLVDTQTEILVCEVEHQKGHKPRMTRSQRGALVIRNVTDTPYVFVVTSKNNKSPIRFTLRDVRNWVETPAGLCLSVTR